MSFIERRPWAQRGSLRPVGPRVKSGRMTLRTVSRSWQRASVLRSGLALAAAVVLGCGAPPPRVDKPAASASASAPSTAAPAIDLSPVPVPANVVAKGRVQSLARTATVMAGVLGAPKESAEQLARGLLADVFKKQLRLEVDPAALADQIALDAPIDIVVTLRETGVGAAISLPLTSLEGVKLAAGEKLVEVAPGEWALQGEKARAKCAVRAAAGAASTRLVCGMTDDDLGSLAPYLVRTAAVGEASAKDLDITVDVAAVNARYGDLVRKQGPVFAPLLARGFRTNQEAIDKAIEGFFKFGAGELGEVLGDVKDLQLSAMFDAEKGISIDLGGAATSSPRSRLIKALSAQGTPASFARGPKDAASGTFFSISDAGLASQIGTTVRGVVDGLLSSSKVGTDAERKKVLAFFDPPFGAGTEISLFGGSTKVTTPKPPKSSAEKWQAGFDALFGFYLVGINVKSELVSKWLGDGVAAFNQPGIQKATQAVISKDEFLSFKKGTPPKSLGKGAAAFEVAIGNKKDQSSGKLQFVVAPDGDKSWIGIGFDSAELVERIARAKEGRETLAKSPFFEAHPSALGSFFTLRSFRSSLLTVALMQVPPSADNPLATAAKSVDEIFEKLPGKGWSPGNVAIGAKAGRISLSVEVPKPMMEEVRVFMSIANQAAAAAMKKQAPPKKP
jgi:hypothetical protein